LIKSSLMWFLVLLAAAASLTAFAPAEKTLGTTARFVYFHGAWVWAALLAFLQAALAGLSGLVTRQDGVHEWSRAWGRTAVLYWIAVLPMSIVIMQTGWNGLFLDEPRWRMSISFAVVGLLLQIGLSLFPLVWTSLSNLIFGLALAVGMTSVESVLHPESPILRSEDHAIRLFFIGLLLLLLLAAWQLARRWHQFERGKKCNAQ
jgi:hypothetical protein